MSSRRQMRRAVIPMVCGIILTAIGINLVLHQPLIVEMTRRVHGELTLAKGTTNFRLWTSPAPFFLKCYLFNVTNPEGVMKGEYPNLVEYGPFNYQQNVEKQIVDIDEENDEITYTTKTVFRFDPRTSLNVSSRDKITILNPAYIGSIDTLTQLPASFLSQYGNVVPKLFPNPNSIFLTGKATDILFNGVKIVCNDKKYKDLELICSTLQTQKPPILREGEKEGGYLFSFFERANNTAIGPFTVNRGVKNISLLGNLVAYKGKRIQKMWSTESCNVVKGTDAVTWPPLLKPTKVVSTFSPDYCRSMDAEYVGDVTVHGLLGSKFVMPERVWFENESDCYCPVVKKKKECLPQGLLDLNKCQSGPVYASEPHFLHGDPTLLQYAQGLKPINALHETYIVIEPLTGAPLSGQKSSQLNLKLSKQPVNLLQNVSEGFFPMVWVQTGNTADLTLLRDAYQLIRLKKLMWFLQLIPLIVGIYVILATLFLYSTPERKVPAINTFTTSVLISSELRRNNLTRRPLRRSTQMLH